MPIPNGKQLCFLPQAAFLIFLPASAGAGVFAAYAGSSGRAGAGFCVRHPPLEAVPAPQVGQLPHKRPAVVEKNPVAFTEIVQSLFTIRGPNKAVFGALAVTQIQDLAVPAITG
jgi:hypothetical protein